MQQLMDSAHVHLLYTAQQTGLKLKLINALYQGRFVLCNDKILHGTHAKAECVIANTADEFLEQIELLMHKNFMLDDLDKRKVFLKTNFNNASNAALLFKKIFE